MKKHFQSPWREYFAVLLIVFVSTVFCYWIQAYAGYRVLSFVLLFVVSLLAFLYGTGPVLLASALSALSWNFLFIPPHYTLHISNTEDFLMFIMFFMIALLNGFFTAQVRRRENLLKIREERSRALYELSKTLAEENNPELLKNLIVEKLKRYFDVNICMMLADEMTVRTPDFLLDGDYETFILQGSHLKTGMIAFRKPIHFTEEQKQFRDTCLELISGKLEREMLNEVAKKAYMLGESDKLYKTLFNSVSHEFRIPVTTIMGATDTLLTENYPVEVQRQLLQEVNIASERLNQLVENLLNISRLESGRITLKRNWYDVHDLIYQVINGLKKELAVYRTEVSIPDDLPMVSIDFGLMEQVIQNIVLNITQYVPGQTLIFFHVDLFQQELSVQIADQGRGFPENEIQHVFDKFYRGNSARTGGTGLGLSIVKGFVEAHQGTVSVRNRIEGGAVFDIRIPVEISEIKIPE